MPRIERDFRVHDRRVLIVRIDDADGDGSEAARADARRSAVSARPSCVSVPVHVPRISWLPGSDAVDAQRSGEDVVDA